MKSLITWRSVAAMGSSVALLTQAALALPTQQGRTIERDAVVAVTLDDAISTKSSKQGEPFKVSVLESSLLPIGTKMQGRILKLQPKAGDKPAELELEFTEILYPNGQTQPMRAVAIPLDKKYVDTKKDGRMVAKKGPNRETVVFGSIAAGTVLGALLNKPFEGAFLGALLGIAGAESGAIGGSGELELKRGTKLGAAFERDVEIAFTPWQRSPNQTVRDVVPIQVMFGLRTLSFAPELQPYRQGDVVMVPLLSFAQQTGLTVTERADGKVVFVEAESNVLRLEHGSAEASLNGKGLKFDSPVIRQGATWFVPIEAIAAITDKPILVNGQRVNGSGN